MGENFKSWPASARQDADGREAGRYKRWLLSDPNARGLIAANTRTAISLSVLPRRLPCARAHIVMHFD